MRRPTSGKPFVVLAVFFGVLFLVAGFVSGAAGLSEGQAMLVAAGITVVTVLVLAAAVPRSYFRK